MRFSGEQGAYTVFWTPSALHEFLPTWRTQPLPYRPVMAYYYGIFWTPKWWFDLCQWTGNALGSRIATPYPNLNRVGAVLYFAAYGVLTVGPLIAAVRLFFKTVGSTVAWLCFALLGLVPAILAVRIPRRSVGVFVVVRHCPIESIEQSWFPTCVDRTFSRVEHGERGRGCRGGSGQPRFSSGRRIDTPESDGGT